MDLLSFPHAQEQKYNYISFLLMLRINQPQGSGLSKYACHRTARAVLSINENEITDCHNQRHGVNNIIPAHLYLTPYNVYIIPIK